MSIQFVEGMNGPYKVSDGMELIIALDNFVESSNLTETGKRVRSGQLCSKLTKCLGQEWPGLKMVNRKFSDIDIWVEVVEGVANISAMISDTDGECYDLDEALVKIVWIIPTDESLRRARIQREYQEFDE